MQDLRLIRQLAVGFDDFKTLNERTRLINSPFKIEEVASSQNIERAVKTAEWLEKNSDCGIWWNYEEGYPDFSPIENRIPYMIFYRGRKPSAFQKRVAIIGTRHCDYLGLQKSFQLGLEASLNGFSVVTGLAEGCDQAAAEGAVSAIKISESFAPCYGVLGCGLDFAYPKFSNKLKQRIIESKGAVLTRFEPGVPPLKYNFPNRNVIVSAMSDFVIAVQAPEKSGTLITTDLALQMGKDVFVSSEGLGQTESRSGSNSLIEDGAVVVSSFSEFSDNAISVSESKFQGPDKARFGNRYYSVNKS